MHPFEIESSLQAQGRPLYFKAGRGMAADRQAHRAGASLVAVE